MEPVIGIGPQPERYALPAGRAFILVLLLISLEIIGNLVYQTVLSESRIDPLIFTGILRAIGMAAILGLAFKWGYSLSHIGLSAGRLKKGLKHGLLWCAGFGLAVGISGAILFLSGTNPLSFFGRAGSRNTSGIIAYFLIGCLIGPIVEDMAFIGIIYNSLRARLNLVFSVLIVAGIFAAAHGLISLSLLIQFTGALLFTLSFEFSGSLLAPLIIHCAGNMAIFAIQFL
ncbi:CPBP family intramembrane metalloprotease [bacterium]|nr:CPBP family intramembrane metalloprotease [bacterium]